MQLFCPSSRLASLVLALIDQCAGEDGTMMPRVTHVTQMSHIRHTYEPKSHITPIDQCGGEDSTATTMMPRGTYVSHTSLCAVRSVHLSSRQQSHSPCRPLALLLTWQRGRRRARPRRCRPWPSDRPSTTTSSRQRSGRRIRSSSCVGSFTTNPQEAHKPTAVDRTQPEHDEGDPSEQGAALV